MRRTHIEDLLAVEWHIIVCDEVGPPGYLHVCRVPGHLQSTCTSAEYLHVCRVCFRLQPCQNLFVPAIGCVDASGWYVRAFGWFGIVAVFQWVWLVCLCFWLFVSSVPCQACAKVQKGLHKAGVHVGRHTG